jgi:hypothetical protein
MKPQAAAVLGLSLLLTGCTAVKVRPAGPHQYAEGRRTGVLDGSGLSASTRESLRILGLPEEDCKSQPTATLDAYLEAARASYAYLFFTPRKPGERALEDRQSQVRDVFNHATERVTTLLFEARRQDRLASPPGDSILLTGSWAVHRGLIDVRLPAERSLQDLIAASRLTVAGIRNVYRRDGFGAEFVAVAAGGEEDAEAGGETGYVAASVVLRFAGSSLEEVMATRDATLEAPTTPPSTRAFLCTDRRFAWPPTSPPPTPSGSNDPISAAKRSAPS